MNSKHKKLSFSSLSLIALACVVLLAAAIYFTGINPFAQTPPAQTQAAAATPATVTPGDLTAGEGALTAYVIDVGQGDSIFLVSPSGKTMLIDTGENSAYGALDAFLKSLDIKKIDALVATHPHSDHIGGMAKIVDNYEIGKVYMTNYAHSTKTFENLLLAVKQKGLKLTYLTGGSNAKLDWSGEVELNVLAPLGTGYKEINDYSIVLRAKIGKTAILLMGDAEKVSEQEMLSALSAELLKADVLKIGHHGSKSSTTKEFLLAVGPRFAVASAGAENSFKHPAEEVVARVKDANIEFYCTADSGTVKIVLDGENVQISTQK